MDDTTPPPGVSAGGGTSPGGAAEAAPPGGPAPGGPAADDPAAGGSAAGSAAGSDALTDIRRSDDGRIVAGVCAGIGRSLGIDPVIPRIVFAVLTLVGFGGVLAYAAAWILLPDQKTGDSYLKRWLGLGENEPQIRLVGLGAAALVALTWTWGWGWPLGPLWIAAVVVIAWVAFREYQERSRNRSASPRTPAYGPPPQPTGSPYVAPAPFAVPPSAPSGSPSSAAPYPPPYAPPPAPPRPPAPPVRPPLPPPAKPPKRPNPRHDGGLLTILTLSLTLITTGTTIIGTDGDLHASVYVAVATGTLALGMLVGTVFGNARPLIFPALLAVAVLAVSVVVPRWDAGRVEATPSSAATVRDSYAIGFGEVVVDLTGVADPEALDGRRIAIENGVGTVRVIVPATLDVDIDATVGAGAILGLGTERGGLGVHLDKHDDTERPDLGLDIDIRIGTVEVVRS